jgi:hypothetical protein
MPLTVHPSRVPSLYLELSLPNDCRLTHLLLGDTLGWGKGAGGNHGD